MNWPVNKSPDPSPTPSSLNRTRSRLRKDLRASWWDGAAFGGMVGFGETFLPPFAFALGVGELGTGLVGSLPLLAGGLMQMISLWAVARLGSRKRWVVACATLQGMTLFIFVATAVACWAGWLQVNTLFLLLVAAAYWGAGLAAGPAWNSWIGSIVPPPIRPRFFSLRTRASQLFTFIGFFSGGMMLNAATTNENVLLVFAVLFLIAGSCRWVSSYMLWQQSERAPVESKPLRLTEIIRPDQQSRVKHGSPLYLLGYLVVVQAAVQVAGPYFTPFMFAKLEFSYLEFMSLLSFSFLTKVLVLPVWGRVAKRIGARSLLWIGGLGIVPASGGWFISQEFGWLIVVQVFSGAMWAAYELAFFLMFFHALPERQRAGLLTLYNLFHSMAWVGGSLIGAAWLYFWQASYDSYLYLFLISSGLRLVSVVLLLGIAPTEDESEPIVIRTVAIRPNSGSMALPLVPALPPHMESRQDRS